MLYLLQSSPTKTALRKTRDRGESLERERLSLVEEDCIRDCLGELDIHKTMALVGCIHEC